MRSSDKLCSCCRTNTLNIKTTSIAFAPALLLRSFSCTKLRSLQNASQSIRSFKPTSGSPICVSLLARSAISNSPGYFFLLIRYTHRSPASVHNAWYLNLDYLPQENRGLIFRDAHIQLEIVWP